MSRYEEFLDGAIDLHCHIDLEFSPHVFRKREPEWEWLPKAEALGMRGVVLKSHWWPTVYAVPYLKQLYRGSVEVWPSIALNPVVGGVELWAVESAAAFGAKMVFLPTWSARNDLQGTGFHLRVAEAFETFRPERIQGVSFLDEDGGLTATGRELLDYCQRHDLTLATGHVSAQESLAFAQAARDLGYRRLVFSHPLSGSVHAPLAAAKRAAELGAWVELCWNAIMPGRMSPVAAVEWIREVGADHVVASTDYFRAPTPNPPELLRFLLGTLYDNALSVEEIRAIAVVNPARALGLPY
ncbi:MAG: amidohydrolase family protein [Chloroflexi bacterium]|nr:amidohydrolase family protein [Chloroflexota bacterium]